MASDSPTPQAPQQRRWQAQCPNCGGTVEFASSASASSVCSYCRSTLLRDGESLRKIGHSADLLEDYSPLQLGAAGRYAGAAFTVIGRLQLAYAEGGWNEWHVLFDGGAKSAWLAEDNGSFVLSFESALQQAAPPAEQLVLGSSLSLDGRSWTVAALTNTRLRAAEGELPRPPLPGEHLVVELRGTQDEVGSLDYSNPEQPAWSVGRAVRLDELALTGLRQSDEGKTLQSRSLECPSCGAALTPTLASTQSIACGQCHAVVDISAGAGADLKHYAQQNGMEPQLPLGSSALLAFSGGAPIAWQVVGYQERCDLPEDSEDEQTFWREYLLFNKKEGFVFLVDTEEGWSLVRPLTGAPRNASGGQVEWAGKRFQKRWDYQAKVTYVLGEFYWQVSRDQRARVSDYEWKSGGRTELLSREQSGQEITWSHGRKLDAAEVARAFKLAPEKSGALSRDASSLSEGGGLLRKILIGLFILFVLILLLRACSRDDCESYKQSYGEASAEYQQCRRNSSGSGVRSSGGSYGGFSSGGGGHK